MGTVQSCVSVVFRDRYSRKLWRRGGRWKRTALRCYPLEEVLRYGFVRALEGLNEDYSIIGMRLFGIEALDAERHVGNVVGELKASWRS